jgi:hypothetical protein
MAHRNRWFTRLAINSMVDLSVANCSQMIPWSQVRRKLPLEGLQALTPEDRGL